MAVVDDALTTPIVASFLGWIYGFLFLSTFAMLLRLKSLCTVLRFSSAVLGALTNITVDDASTNLLTGLGFSYTPAHSN